jgi:16S rRNA C967 or C1407 C5-methylase (RsmB/RsmF family)
LSQWYTPTELSAISRNYTLPPNHTIYRISPLLPPDTSYGTLCEILSKQALPRVAKTVAVTTHDGYDDSYTDPLADLLPDPSVSSAINCCPTPLPAMPSCYYALTSSPLQSTYASACSALRSYYTDRSPGPQSSIPVIITDTICGEAVLRGSNVYTPGVVSAMGDIRLNGTVYVWCLLPGYDKSYRRGLSLFGITTPLLYLGVGVYEKRKKADLFNTSTGLAVTMERVESSGESSGSVPSLNNFGGSAYSGAFYSQNLPSLIPSVTLAVGRGDVVLDMCCAPGGKTSHLGTLLYDCIREYRDVDGGEGGDRNGGDHNGDRGFNADDGFIICFDRSKTKIKKVQELVKSQKLDRLIYPRTADSTKIHDPDLPAITREELYDKCVNPRGRAVYPFPAETFDKILLDPPCSALGLRPRLNLARSTASEALSFAQFQTGFIHAAVRMLKVGGRLVYSTCTYNVSENEGNVRYLLDTYPYMKLIDVNSKYGKYGLTNTGLSEEERKMVRRFDSCERDDYVSDVGEVERDLDSIGFFVAYFEKVEREEAVAGRKKVVVAEENNEKVGDV